MLIHCKGNFINILYEQLAKFHDVMWKESLVATNSQRIIFCGSSPCSSVLASFSSLLSSLFWFYDLQLHWLVQSYQSSTPLPAAGNVFQHQSFFKLTVGRIRQSIELYWWFKNFMTYSVCKATFESAQACICKSRITCRRFSPS